MGDSAAQYLDYEKKMQRSGLFRLLVDKYSISKALYPGSYIHISPSFYIKEVVYVDTDSKAKKFFNDESLKKLIEQRKTYSEETKFRFHPINYQKNIPEDDEYFDLLISQYAGFVSFYCKKYLKMKGYLIANNSHGDAGIAYLDPSFSLIAVVNYRGGRFYHSTKNLDNYFIPKKKNHDLSGEYLLELKRGIGYTKSASHYIFEKIES